MCQSFSLTALATGRVKMAPTAKPINGIIDRNLIAVGFKNCLKKCTHCSFEWEKISQPISVLLAPCSMLQWNHSAFIRNHILVSEGSLISQTPREYIFPVFLSCRFHAKIIRIPCNCKRRKPVLVGNPCTSLK